MEVATSEHHDRNKTQQMKWGSGALQAASRDTESHPTDGKAGQGGNVRTEISPEAARGRARLRVGTGQMKGEATPCRDGVDTP